MTRQQKRVLGYLLNCASCLKVPVVNISRKYQNIGVYHQVFRLQVLQNGVDADLARGNHHGAARLCAQAAREVGGQYLAQSVVAINAVAEAPPKPRWDLSKLTDEEIETLERIGKKTMRSQDPTS